LLKKNTIGTDPFYSSGSGANITLQPCDPQFIAARFLFAFQAQIGLPRGMNPSALPNIVTLGSRHIRRQFNMLCSQFTLVQLDLGNKTWLNTSQPANALWVFAPKVNMHLSTVNQSAFSDLPRMFSRALKTVVCYGLQRAAIFF
jgi:hypothetical protein